MIKPWMIIGGVMFLVALGSVLIRPRDIPWQKRLDRPGWLFFGNRSGGALLNR